MPLRSPGTTKDSPSLREAARTARPRPRARGARTAGDSASSAGAGDPGRAAAVERDGQAGRGDRAQARAELAARDRGAVDRVVGRHGVDRHQVAGVLAGRAGPAAVAREVEQDRGARGGPLGELVERAEDRRAGRRRVEQRLDVGRGVAGQGRIDEHGRDIAGVGHVGQGGDVLVARDTDGERVGVVERHGVLGGVGGGGRAGGAGVRAGWPPGAASLRKARSPLTST